MSQAALTDGFEIFDKLGHLLPIAELEPHIAKMDEGQQARFAVLKKAALFAEAAIEATKEAQRQVTVALALVKSTEAELRRVRPPVSPIDAARQWMRTTNPASYGA